MIYCDTSVLVAALTSEIHSVAARSWLMTNSDQRLAISDWVLTEFASALAMKVRRGAIDIAQRHAIEMQWRKMLAETFTVVPVMPDHFGTAATLVDTGRNGLRASDALHLAISFQHGFSLVTFDEDLADAARHLSMLVEIDRS